MRDAQQELIARRRQCAGIERRTLYPCLRAGDRAGVRALLDGGIPAIDVACEAAAWCEDSAFFEALAAGVDTALLGGCFDIAWVLPPGRGELLLALGARPRPFSLMAEPDFSPVTLRDRDGYFRLVSALVDAGASVHARSACRSDVSRAS